MQTADKGTQIGRGCSLDQTQNSCNKFTRKWVAARGETCSQILGVNPLTPRSLWLTCNFSL